MLTAMSAVPGRRDGLPFQGPALWPRVIPFASVALLASAAAFRLPWPRLPEWAPVVVPLVTGRCPAGLSG